jgi:hypothetical protein
METFNVFDVCVFAFTGLSTGMAIGLAIRNKQIKNLREEVESGNRSYMNLADSYMELFSSHRNLKLANAKKEIAKRGPGRPKGSKNKPKQDGRPTTRKYTRKSSK